MNLASFSKRMARATRNWRVSLGLASEPAATSAELARSQARRALPGGRLTALESDIDHVVGAWNRHIPQILGEIGEARRAAAECRLARADVERLEATLNALSERVTALVERIEADEPAIRPAEDITPRNGSK